MSRNLESTLSFTCTGRLRTPHRTNCLWFCLTGSEDRLKTQGIFPWNRNFPSDLTTVKSYKIHDQAEQQVCSFFTKNFPKHLVKTWDFTIYNFYYWFCKLSFKPTLKHVFMCIKHCFWSLYMSPFLLEFILLKIQK